MATEEGMGWNLPFEHIFFFTTLVLILELGGSVGFEVMTSLQNLDVIPKIPTNAPRHPSNRAGQAPLGRVAK